MRINIYKIDRLFFPQYYQVTSDTHMWYGLFHYFTVQHHISGTRVNVLALTPLIYTITLLYNTTLVV